MTKDWQSLSENEWKQKLSPEAYNILRKKRTEPAYSGKYNDWHESGIFTCGACGQKLFNSEDKFDSGSGWPSFHETISDQSVDCMNDNSHGMNRKEIICSRCKSHLGHVFSDGPPPTGKRYCINSLALDFMNKDKA